MRMISRKANRNFYTILTGAAAAGAIVICTLGQNVHSERVTEKRRASAAQETPPYCRVCEYNGKIGVFHYGQAEPYMTLDVNTALLSEYDREQFRNGIELDTEAELKKLIEDFSD